MFDKRFNLITVLLFLIVLLPTKVHTQVDSSSAHIEIMMRMIGNEILLSMNDSISQVMPIEKNGDRYKIGFKKEFQLKPFELALAINSIVKRENIANKYRVEVELCDSNLIVYGYEFGLNDSIDQIACSRRIQAKMCYVVFFTILDKSETDFINNSEQVSNINHQDEKGLISSLPIIFLLIVLLFLIGMAILFYNKRKNNRNNSDIITMGKYHFNQRKMMLSLRGKKTELTSKETDLLVLLNQFANRTIKRETILEKVWGDEGDYVGRTLDVFISKLRKKLEHDSEIKIVNIRGVGYKLILNN